MTKKMQACYTVIPDDQRMTFTIKPTPGALIRAKTVGGTIRSMARLLQLCGDEAGVKQETFITGLSMSEEGGIEIEFSVLPFAENAGAEEITE